MSGFDAKTGIFQLTATKASDWFRRQDVPEELRNADEWQVIQAVLKWQGLEIVKVGKAYLDVKATPEQLWEALSGQPSNPERSRHYYPSKDEPNK